MLTKKTLTALFSLALAGSMAVPAFAAEGIPAQQTTLELKPVISEYTPVISDYQPVISDENPLTRAELISVLYEKEGKPGVNFAMNYTDVSPDAEYAEAIRWASSEGIAGGYGNGSFGPEDAVTREQMAVVLYRYAQSNGQGFTGNWAFPLTYGDADEISEFAYEAVCWISMKNIMGDADDNLFVPTGEVTHQDANSMLQEYFSVTDKVEIANPFLSCKTMNEAAQIAGFSMELPASVPSWVSSSMIRAVESSMIEVLYEGEDQQLTVRKAIGTENISGDHSVYSELSTEEVNGYTVTLKGDEGKVMVATWSNSGYTYAVHTAAGLDHDTMLSIVSAIR